MKLNSNIQSFRLNSRTAFGCCLITISLVAAFVLTNAVGAKAKYYQASSEIPAGAQFTLQNLKVVELVAAGLTPNYLLSGTPILGKFAKRDYAAGELIPSSGIINQSQGSFQSVALSAAKGAFPNGVLPGDQVDIYAIPNNSSPQNNRSVKRVLSDATVLYVDNQSANLGGDVNFTVKVSASDLTSFFTSINDKSLAVVKNA